MTTPPLPRLAVAAAAIMSMSIGAPAADAAAGPSRATAAAYAHRTYVTQSGTRRTFALAGGRATARGSDGSLITAFPIVIADSGDGSGQAVLLFRGRRFLGWASAYDTLHLRVTGGGRAISVRYGVYRGDDPFCCPSSTKTVHYRYRGGRIVADGAPPRIYGKRGNRLHLSGS